MTIFSPGDTILLVDSLGHYYKASVSSIPANNNSSNNLINPGPESIRYGVEYEHAITLSTIKKTGSITTTGGVYFTDISESPWDAGSIAVSKFSLNTLASTVHSKGGSTGVWWMKGN